MQYFKFTIKQALFVLLICAFATGAFAQPASTVRIVDNNFNAPTGPLIYSTIQDAVDAAVPGDVIYIQPSPTKYGSATTFKALHFKGIGFNLDKDQPHISNVTNIILANNVDNTQNASGSTIEGLDVDLIRLARSGGTPSFTMSDVTVNNCNINFLQVLIGANVIAENFELSNSRVSGDILFYSPLINSVIRNNLLETMLFLSSQQLSLIISNNIIYGAVRKESVGDNLVLQNNNFIGTKNSSSSFTIQMTDAIVANNIFYGRTPSVATGGSTSDNFQRNIFTNNLSYETGDDTLPPTGGGVGNSGDGNIVGSSPLFVNVLLLNSWSSDYDFTLQAGSPAIDAGSDGTDIGISGGPYADPDPNFSLVTTPLPTIQIFNTSTVINPGDNLEIRVQAKTN